MAASTDIIWSPKYEPVQTRNSYKSGDTNYFTKCGYMLYPLCWRDSRKCDKNFTNFFTSNI